MNEMHLDVKGDGKGRLKLDWRDERWYHVDLDALCRKGEKARVRLQGVIDAAMKKRPLGRPLKDLARAGAELREQIFLSEPEPDIGGAERWGYDTDTEWFSTFDDAALHIRIDQRIYIPWGLAYDGKPEELPEDEETAKAIGHYNGFWCVKYRLSTLYNRIRDSVVRQPRQLSSAKRIKLMNQTAWTRALVDVPQEEQALDGSLFNQTISSTQDFDQEWKKKKRNLETDLLYFFGHANGLALELAKGQVLPIEEFKEKLRRNPPQEKPACIVFLNGCQTVIGDDEKGGFLEATGFGGYCGFIGAEAMIPDVFALRFGNLFVSRLLYSGDRAIDVMHQMRTDHWPLSLVYNLSCHPDFHFKVDLPPTVLPSPANFSTGPLGSCTV
jgi:hypothetical protein